MSNSHPFFRWVYDHGQSLLKIVMRHVCGLEIVDSVNCCFLVAIYDTKEYMVILNGILTLLDLKNLLVDPKDLRKGKVFEASIFVGSGAYNSYFFFTSICSGVSLHANYD